MVRGTGREESREKVTRQTEKGERVSRRNVITGLVLRTDTDE